MAAPKIHLIEYFPGGGSIPVYQVAQSNILYSIGTPDSGTTWFPAKDNPDSEGENRALLGSGYSTQADAITELNRLMAAIGTVTTTP